MDNLDFVLLHGPVFPGWPPTHAEFVNERELNRFVNSLNSLLDGCTDPTSARYMVKALNDREFRIELDHGYEGDNQEEYYYPTPEGGRE